MKLDVFLDTGVCLTTPSDIDPDSEEGLKIVKGLAVQQFLALLNSGRFDIHVEVFDDEGNELPSDKFDPETCSHQAAVQAEDGSWYCPGCESRVTFTENGDE